MGVLGASIHFGASLQVGLIGDFFSIIQRFKRRARAIGNSFHSFLSFPVQLGLFVFSSEMKFRSSLRFHGADKPLTNFPFFRLWLLD